MIIHRGQVWVTKDPEERYRRDVFVCGVEDNEWVWYLVLLQKWNVNSTRPAWQKARIAEFERKYAFKNCVITKRAYWKKRATGDLIQIIGLKDDGWRDVNVYYDLSKIDIHYFLEYFKPASKEETLAAIARDLNTPKNMRKMKRRLEMVKGDPSQPVTYE